MRPASRSPNSRQPSSTSGHWSRVSTRSPHPEARPNRSSSRSAERSPTAALEPAPTPWAGSAHTSPVNLFDLVVVVLVAVALLVGFRSGALPQLSGLGGALIGGTAALIALPHLKEPLEGLELSVRAFVVLAGLLFAVGLGEAIGSAIGRAAARLIGQGVFGALDRAMGAIVGCAQALLIVWLT